MQSPASILDCLSLYVTSEYFLLNEQHHFSIGNNSLDIKLKLKIRYMGHNE